MITPTHPPIIRSDGGTTFPPEIPEYSRNPGGWGWPLWASHITLFVAGAITMNVAYLAPLLVIPVLAVFGALFAFFAALGTRRWK